MITKAGEPQTVYVGSRRLKDELQKRRFLDDNDYVFGTEEGRFVASFDRSWKRLFLNAGLSVGRLGGYVWHDLRHEFAARVAERTDNVVDIRDMLRHGDIRTSERYLKARERRLKELAGQLGQEVS
jgi:integrase